jgi:HEAT repeat protein
MKKNSNSEIDNELNNLPNNLAGLIKESLETKSLSKKLSARETLVKMGGQIIPQIHKLLSSENDSLRMETAKITELIADRRSIPLLIILLDDPLFDIRWIAAEGLIKIGRRSICPLLKSVRDGKSSLLFNRGTHHILLSLLDEKEKDKLMPLLQGLDNYHELSETASVQASIALKTVFKCNT